MKFTAALFALGAVSAVDQIDMFAPHNWSNTMKMIVNQDFSAEKPVTAGQVTWSQCDDDAGVFIFDSDSTSYTPNPIVKGQHATLTLGGLVQDSLEVTNVHFHADWKGTGVYDQDFKQDNKYDSQYSYEVGWDIPSFTPSGEYTLKFTGTGNAGSVSGGNVLCISAVVTL